MSDNKGKLAGGAAVGAGGILVAVLKSGSAEMHAVEAAGRAARAAGEVGHVGAVAGKGAGVALAGERALSGAERVALLGATERELGALKPVVLASDDGARVGAKGLAPVTGNAAKAASGKTSVKEILAKQDVIGPKDLLDQLSNVWDFAQPLVEGEDEEVDRKFASMGVDFHRDVVPSMAGQPLPGIAGAKRTLLSDGRTLIPAGRLPDVLSTATMDRQAVDDLANEVRMGDPKWAVFVEAPLPDWMPKTLEGSALVTVLRASRNHVWDEVATAGVTSYPQVLEHGAKRYVQVRALSYLDAGASRLVLVRHVTDGGR